MLISRYLIVAAVMAASTLLSGCQTGPGKYSDPHTGLTAYYSERLEAQGGLLSSLHARAFHSSAQGYGVKTEYMNTGLGWMFIDEAYSFGKRFRYEVVDRDVLGCGGGCSVVENGIFRMSPEDFEVAAARGLEFKLVGSKGGIVGRLPASTFQNVLRQMGGARSAGPRSVGTEVQPPGRSSGLSGVPTLATRRNSGVASSGVILR